MSKPRKSSDKKPKLKPKQAKYMSGVAAGKTKKQAALDAGYAPSMALSPNIIESSVAVKAAFSDLLRRLAPPDKVAQRIAEGLDAMETKFATFEGRISDSAEVIAWTERRKYAEMAAKFGCYVEPETDNKTDITIGVIVRTSIPRPQREAVVAADGHD